MQGTRPVQRRGGHSYDSISGQQTKLIQDKSGKIVYNNYIAAAAAFMTERMLRQEVSCKSADFIIK